jgi:predicted adenylyl cyclase CyaB
MPANVEIKARVRDSARIKVLAEALASTSSQLIEQEDVFFIVPRGRLKLRIFSSFSAELIYYEREDQHGPKESRYSISRTSEPDSLKAVLQMSLGIRGIVRKQRALYLVGQTRIHLDEVDGLGSFVELEVVMQTNQSHADAVQIARRLMAQLEIQDSDLIEQAPISTSCSQTGCVDTERTGQG